jgi:hypothetical protein
MARIPVTRTQLSSREVTVITTVAADVTNKHYADMTGYEILLAFNSGLSTRAVTVNSNVDPTGRTADISDSVAAGEIHAYGPFKFLTGWAFGGSSLNFEAAHADVLFAWVCVPF